ncbi:hypothetical protein FAZ15_14320 [Sphingobacterium olei]|uniref:Uncharacterized protein n=1 Tax=Sphingobacterium olei TaxID=2571155 RepID=A0A4U0NYU7_9SPHI|nr:hypothetical protein [Sphingobacterium olei]TJZ60056.1 hypothetical protein FAZ15_14320 [Sphingobacterium olei]
MGMKQINIEAEISIKNFSEQIQLKLHLNQIVGVELCMSLFLLKENLINAIGLKFRNFFILFKSSGDRFSYCESVALDNGVFKGQISNDSLDYILHYILKFYRDGIAEAEHVDIDFLNNNGKELTLTISCNIYQEYSADEIKKML